MSRRSLPKKLSDAILVALDDLSKVERMKDTYVVDMGAWHRPIEEGDVVADLDYNPKDVGKCAVCFAGSVIACTLKEDPKTYVSFEGFSEELQHKFGALDDVRTGDITNAIGRWYAYDIVPRNPLVMFNDDPIDVADYYTDRAQFKRDMRRIAKNLADLGL